MMIKIRKVATHNGVDLYSRGLVTKDGYEELFPIGQIPVYDGDIIQKGKKNFVKIKSEHKKPSYYL
jgi:hypothetical protein